MAMNFELSISGMCVIVLKSKDDRPAQPDGIEVLCVKAHHHRPRLSYWPRDVSAEVEPELCVDPQGHQLAAWDLTGKMVTLNFRKDYQGRSSLTWGPPKAEAPKDPPEEAWMNWVPDIQDLGVATIRRGKPGALPKGASARIVLPPGELKARNVVRDPDTDEYLEWEFPAKGFKRALANDLVFTAKEVGFVKLNWNGEETLGAQLNDGLLEMGISNDMETVPLGYNDGIQEITHLMHLADLAKTRAVVQPPKLVSNQKTGWPICNQVFFVDKG